MVSLNECQTRPCSNLIRQVAHMLPLKPPQKFQLPGRHVEGVDEDIIQTIAAPNSNHFLFITTTRLFVYQAKPFAPLACHERTADSIEIFGTNCSITTNLPFGSRVDGLLIDQLCDPAIGYKLYYYVATKNNFILVYEVLHKTSEISVFKEYGVSLNPSAKDGVQYRADDDDMDDEVLTVFAGTENHKLIQNGYTISKQKGFLQFLRNDELDEELPIRRAELKLTVILKFDHAIIDVIGLIAHDIDNSDQVNQYLLVLFKHGLQVLKLEDFKLIENKLIQVKDGLRLIYCDGGIIVFSSSTSQRTMNHILFSEELVQSQELTISDKTSAFTDLATLGTLITLALGSTIVHYDVQDRVVLSESSNSFGVQSIVPLSSDDMMLLTCSGIVFMSKWGNILLFSSTDHYSFNVLNASVMDNTLLISGTNGTLLLWDLWKRLQSSLSNFRAGTITTFMNDNNDILLYSPMGEQSNTSTFQTIKLPTRTINNNVSLCKTNGSLRLMAVYVSNKDILLINFLTTNTWISFDQVNLKNFDWIGDDYLLCHFIDEDGEGDLLKCFHFPSLNRGSVDLEEFKIWEWEPPKGQRISSFHVNTLSNYKLLKYAKDKDEEDSSKKLFATSEILIALSDSKIVLFDVLSSVHPTGVILIQKFHKFSILYFAENSLRDLKWMYRYNEGFLAWIRDKIVRIGKQDNDEWAISTLYDRVEQIIEINEEDIVFSAGNDVLVYNFSHLWVHDDPFILNPIVEEEYPISISLRTATLHNISCTVSKNHYRLSISHGVYLDKVIDRNLDLNVDINKIDEQYHDLKHYKFCLEKILSNKVLEHRDLRPILSLIDTFDSKSPGVHVEVGKLEIIGKCLRKIETKHWDYLFMSLQMTPRDLVSRCLELSEAKILGTILMVFLNYDEGGNCPKKPVSAKKRKNKNKRMNEAAPSENQPSDTSLSNILKDGTMISQVLKIFVLTATLSATKEQAQEYWEFALQLIRFLRALDSKENTNLAETCLSAI